MSYPNILIESTCFTRFKLHPLLRFWQNLSATEPIWQWHMGSIWMWTTKNQQLKWDKKKTSWKPATSMPPVAEKMFRTLGSYAIIPTYDICVCIMMALRSRGSLRFDHPGHVRNVWQRKGTLTANGRMPSKKCRQMDGLLPEAAARGYPRGLGQGPWALNGDMVVGWFWRTRKDRFWGWKMHWWQWLRR